MPTIQHNKPHIIFRHRGIVDYLDAWQEMKTFTENRDESTPDEVWFLEHPPVYTQGQAGKAEHILNAGDIPVVQVDRGGQVTYHGPGQLVVYVLLDIKRRNLGVRNLVTLMEESLVELLSSFGLKAYPKADAPGVYLDLNQLDLSEKNQQHPAIVSLDTHQNNQSEAIERDEAKIASLGLRVRKGCTFHGLSLNISCDLAPFEGINPCGYAGMKVTRLDDLTATRTAKIATRTAKIDSTRANIDSVSAALEKILVARLQLN